jgi:Methyltransferase domain
MSSIRKSVKSLMPASIVNRIRSLRTPVGYEDYKNLSTREVFEKIYETNAWGQPTDPDQKFYSGTGSHEGAVASVYLNAVRGFLGSLPGPKPDVVDLGCGDFSVGSQVRPLCNGYIACDIVGPLIEFNRQNYRSLDVDFRVLDLARDELPPADIVFVRQVLQHLSNAEVKRALPQLAAKYKYLVLTEHLPAEEDFAPNLDKPAGPGIRMQIDSGIVLTRAPFKLRPRKEERLCQVEEDGGMIRTTLYTLC